MSLQQDPSKSFGSSSYFKNKDQQRQQVNVMRQSERQKRITTQLLRRNMKQAMRRGEDGGRFIQAAEAADLDIFGRTGLGEEASVAMERARYDADQNFNAASRAKAQQDSKTKGSNIKPDEKTNPADGKTAGTVDGGTATPAGDTAIPEATKPATGIPFKSTLSRPDWADDVKNDRTFRGVNFDDPGTLAKIQGKTRGEVYDMLRKAQATRFMAGANEEGDKLRNKLRDKELNNQATARAADFYTKQGQVDSKVESALNDAQKALASKDGVLSKGDYNSFRDALEIADSIKPDDKNLLPIIGALNTKMLEQGFPSPDASYYSMTTEEKYADFQKRSAMGSSTKGTDVPYNYVIVDGKVAVKRNPEYVSKEYKVFEELNKQSKDYNSPLLTNARNQVITEAETKKQRLNELALEGEKYRAQRRESLQQRSVNADMLPTIGYGKIEQ
jgi:hypothetical protein